MGEKTAKSKSGQNIWTAAFINMFVTNILIHTGTYMMNTLSATYADQLGATSVVIGLVSSLFALTALIFKIISAPAVDTFNKKYILIGAITVLLISYVCYGFSRNLPMLIVSRLLTGTGMAFTATCCMTIASDTLPLEKMATGIGYFALGTALSQAFAPTLGLKMTEVFGYQATFFILAAVMLVAVVYVSTLKMKFKRVNKFRITWNSIIAKEALLPALLLLLLTISFGVLNAFLVLFAEEKGVSTNIGYFFTVYAVSMLFTRPLIGRMADRYGTVKTIIPSMVCFMLSFIIISFSNSLGMFLFAGFISAFGYGGSLPVLQAVCMKSVPRERRGSASSTSFVGTDLGNLIGPVMSGAIAEWAGYENMWRLMVVPIAAGILISYICRKRLEV